MEAFARGIIEGDDKKQKGPLVSDFMGALNLLVAMESQSQSRNSAMEKMKKTGDEEAD